MYNVHKSGLIFLVKFKFNNELTFNEGDDKLSTVKREFNNEHGFNTGEKQEAAGGKHEIYERIGADDLRCQRYRPRCSADPAGRKILIRKKRGSDIRIQSQRRHLRPEAGSMQALAEY